MHRRSLSLLSASLILAGCGAGGGTANTSPAGTTTAQTAVATAPVVITLVVPPKAKAQTALTRQLKYISPSTLSMGIVVSGPTGNTSTPSYFTCNTQTCTASLQAPVGNDSLALTLYDGANGAGNKLSVSTGQAVTVQGGQTTSVNLTLNPVVDHAVITAANQTFAAGTPTSLVLHVNIFDADGNTLIGPGVLVNAAGSPINLTIGANNQQSGGSGAITVANAVITTPNAATQTASYNGGPITGATLTLTPSATIPGGIATATVTAVPTGYEYPIPSANTNPGGIALGPDGNLWFTEMAGNKIGKITPAGVVTEYTCGTGPVNIVAGPDGNLWFAEKYANKVGKMTTSGVLTEYSPTTATSQPNGITVGPDNNIWFTETAVSKIAKITTSGVVTEYAEQMNANLGGIATGPDGRLWYALLGGSQIGAISVGGTITDFPTATGGDGPQYVTGGPDGNVWYTASSGNAIGRITPAGVATDFTTGLSQSSSPNGIVTGKRR